ncbi:MAG TPA: NUDIX domain-containing protein [Solirubrobacteraceae bacterium]|nr:NUDIX domain-containing protein [Solirubrobacteraceae bacterium]
MLNRVTLRRSGRLLLMWTIRHFPLPWRLKWLLIWLATPKVALSACAILEDSLGRLLVLRSRYSGDWQLPGGSVERHESVAEAVRRECREELGLELTEVRLTSIAPVLHGLTQIALYRASLAAGPIRLSDEHTEWGYLTQEALPEHLRRLIAAAAAG